MGVPTDSALPSHPHVHALSTDGLLAREGESLPLDPPDAKVVEELFRRVVVAALLKAERLSEGFAERLLGREHPGFREGSALPCLLRSGEGCPE